MTKYFYKFFSAAPSECALSDLLKFLVDAVVFLIRFNHIYENGRKIRYVL